MDELCIIAILLAAVGALAWQRDKLDRRLLEVSIERDALRRRVRTLEMRFGEQVD